MFGAKHGRMLSRANTRCTCSSRQRGLGPRGSPLHAGAAQGFDPVVKAGYGAHFPASIRLSEAAKDLMKKLLTHSLADRLSAQEALLHPFFLGEASGDPIQVRRDG